MAITRRTFLKASVGGAVGVSALGFDLTPAYAAVRQLKIRNARHSALEQDASGSKQIFSGFPLFQMFNDFSPSRLEPVIKVGLRSQLILKLIDEI